MQTREITLRRDHSPCLHLVEIYASVDRNFARIMRIREKEQTTVRIETKTDDSEERWRFELVLPERSPSSNGWPDSIFSWKSRMFCRWNGTVFYYRPDPRENAFYVRRPTDEFPEFSRTVFQFLLRRCVLNFRSNYFQFGNYSPRATTKAKIIRRISPRMRIRLRSSVRG